MKDRLILVGNSEISHVGAHFLSAAKELGYAASFCDVRNAYAGSIITRKFNWIFRAHRPSRLAKFGSEVAALFSNFKESLMITTGIAPLDKNTLYRLKQNRVTCYNYLTDDPWNPAHKADWFMEALTAYDHIFTTRRSNIGDLREHGCGAVSFLPFAYSPQTHFMQPPMDDDEKKGFDADILFVGGADRERLPYIKALVRARFKVSLYGGYWGRFPEMRRYWRGFADPLTLRKAVGGAKISLCLIRRSNRDGNSMRTFEVPAMCGCMLAEYTDEHLEIFGKDGENIYYFKNVEEMVEKTRILVDDEDERMRIRTNAHAVIRNNKHTYKDRLAVMLDIFKDAGKKT